MTKKLPRLYKIVIAILVLYGLSDGPVLVSSKMLAASQQNLRDAKTQQDADRRATEVLRQKILADSAAKFDQQQRSFGDSDNNYSWNLRYRKSTNIQQ
ncbi:hypothetical protein P3T76_004626 [Phytophthora citrophthora]|uniref:Uncharacterized protein n=1 Tax=Phytophthora citrophthora TaxID=4793 RepID=A0AAD9GRH1_9STRA|nr:hypothetical protein P3T76_004626 [Phytophthora citrophthora]